MNERAITFGPAVNLTGILCEPDEATRRAGVPLVLMLNAGLLHRVGPHRMSVLLARQLAAAGISSLRFDLGGRGDSEASLVTGSDDERVLVDIIEAMDHLEQRGLAHRFVLFGLCAGADNAHLAAVCDTRVAGAVLLDGYGWRTPGYYLHHYLPRMRNARAWIGFVRRLVLQALRSRAESQAAADAARAGMRRPFGERRVVEQELEQLIGRGARLLYVYSGGVEGYYNHRRQFFEMFPHLSKGGYVEVEFYPRADHTYTVASERERMLARVVGWFESRDWGAPRDAPVA
jgi:dienelactone hydrolase